MHQPNHTRSFLALSLNFCLLAAITFAHGQVESLAQGRTLVFDRGEPVKLNSPTAIQVSTLQVGSAVERKIGPGEAHVYSLDLEENRYVQAVVDQRGIDVVIRVSSPTGKSLGDFDSPNGRHGPEPIAFVAATAGSYRLTVTPLKPEDRTVGEYQIKVIEIREATEQELQSSKYLEVMKAKGLALLTEIDGLIGQSRSPHTRTRAQLRVARLLWDVDEKRSTKYLSDAANTLKEILADVDLTSVEYLRSQNTLTQLRFEIIQLLASRDPEAALSLLHSVKRPADPYQNEREQMSHDAGLELWIGNQLLAKDPKRAFEIARQQLKHNYSSSLVDTIKLLQQKNPELAAQLANEVGSKLASETLLKNSEAAMLAARLFGSCRSNQNEIRAGISNEVFLKPIISSQSCRELMQKVLDESLAFKVSSVRSYSPEREAAWGLLSNLQNFGPELDSIVTGSTAAVRKKLDEFNPLTEGSKAFQEVQSKINEAPLDEGAVKAIEGLPSEYRDQLYAQVASSAAAQGNGAFARELLKNRFANPYQQRQTMFNIDQQEIYYFLAHGRVEDALRVISALPTPRERATMLGNMINQLGQGQKKEVVLRMLSQARALLAPEIQAQDQEQMRALLELARAYARYDSKRAFEIVNPLVVQLNELCTAARTLEGFGPQNFEDDELSLEAGTPIANITVQLTGVLGDLALTDFERAKATADGLQPTELRLRAYLDIAQKTVQAK